jgi:long-chain acyl-CoA synthetase
VLEKPFEPAEPIHRGPPLEPFDRETLAAIFLGASDRFGAAPALRFFLDGRWCDLSYDEASERVARIAAWLVERGIGPGDRVALLSENRPEWALFDYATLCLGAVTVPVYPTLPPDQVRHILDDSAARGVVVSSAEQRAKVASAGSGSIEWIVQLDGAEGSDASGVIGLQEVLGTAPLPELRGRAATVQPDDLATLVYSSGTTGVPKGVMLTHANVAFMVAATRQHGSVPAGSGDVCLSILPLSHVFERAAAYFFWDSGVTIAYARALDTLAEDLLEVRPHVMVSVPRLFEKLHARVARGPGVRGRLGGWAAALAARTHDRRYRGGRLSTADAVRFRIADRTVFATLRRRTGGRLRGFISGGAPLSGDVATLFFASGLPIYEGYGLTETSPVLSANRPGATRLGTVGVPYPGVELRIGPEGEIQARSPGVMEGYWRSPERTGAAVDEDGWFRTGDVGEFDADGFLRITDRLKDLIVTAGGKNIAPQPMESEIMRSPYVAQAIMVGDRRAFPALLVVPDWEAVDRWAAERGIDVSDREAATRDPALLELLHDETVDRVSDFARHEVPKRFSLLPEEFTVESGLLTPTLKVRRRAIEHAFQEAIEKLYAEFEHVREEVRNLRHRQARDDDVETGAGAGGAA